MDFNDTPEEAAFRAEARAFLEANAPQEPRRGRRCVGDHGADGGDACKAWQAKKAEAGFAGITWPKEWGGRGGIADPAGDLQPGGGQLPGAAGPVRDRPGHVHARR